MGSEYEPRVNRPENKQLRRDQQPPERSQKWAELSPSYYAQPSLEGETQQSLPGYYSRQGQTLLSSLAVQQQAETGQNKAQTDKGAQKQTENPYEKMDYGDKLLNAMQRVPAMLEGDAKALFQQLISDPKFAAVLATGAGAFAALQFTPAGPAVNLAFTIAFGLKAGVEIGKFFYQAFQAKDEAGINAAAESLKNAVIDGGPLLISGLAGGFKTLNGLLTKLGIGKQGIQAVKALSGLPDDAQRALRELGSLQK
jgi:hypothetical protein